jgi:hypothetical protein
VRDVNEPQPTVPAGYFALQFDRVTPPTFSSVSVGTSEETLRASVASSTVVSDGVRLEFGDEAGVFTLGGRVYLHAEFVLHNDGDAVLEDLVLLCYHHEAFRAGSAVSQPMLVAGWPATDAMVHQIKPTHRLDLNLALIGTPAALTGRPTMSDFTALLEVDVPILADAPFVRTVFPYGFRIARGQPILPGETASFRVAFSLVDARRSAASQAMASFTWNAVLVSVPTSSATQALEENHPAGWTAVLARAGDVGQVVAIGPGSRDAPDAAWCERLVGLPDVRIAGEGHADAAYRGLVETPGLPQFVGCEGAIP